jgi:hypothetical protein
VPYDLILLPHVCNLLDEPARAVAVVHPDPDLTVLTAGR